MVEDEEKEQNEKGQEEEEEEVDDSTERKTTPSKSDNSITVKSRTASHEAFDWLMSPVSEKHTQILNNNPIVEEEAEEGSRNVMEEEGVVL